MSDTVETIRDRVREFRRVPAGELQANPRNWRTHPEGQRKALEGVLRAGHRKDERSVPGQGRLRVGRVLLAVP